MFIGNQRVVKLLDKAVSENRIAQSYIFSGPQNVGKFTLALDFARRLTGGAGEKVDLDLMILEPEKEEKKGIIKVKDIPIEKIRDLQHELSLSHYGGGRRAAVIDGADRMNLKAQNALLKTLEEPAEGAVIILVTSDENKLLPTLRSRCQKMRFNLVPDAEMAEMISGDPSGQEIIFWSLGRPGLAVTLLGNREELDLRRLAVREIREIISSPADRMFSLAESLSKNTAVLMERLELWSVLLRESALSRPMGVGIEPAKATALLEKVCQSIELIRNTNASPRLVTENLFLHFR